MKKYLSYFVLFLFCFSVSFAYSEDINLSGCLKDANGSYSKQYDCYYKVKEYYQNENKRILQELQTELPAASYLKVTKNQKIFSDYLKSLNNGEIQILNQTLGFMYQTFAQEILLSANKTNYQILNVLKNNIYNNNKPNIPSNINLSTKLNFYYNETEKNFSDKQFRLVAQSQSTWKEYQNDTINQILPMLKISKESKINIQKHLLKDRIDTLFSLNSIIYEVEGFPTFSP